LAFLAKGKKKKTYLAPAISYDWLGVGTVSIWPVANGSAAMCSYCGALEGAVEGGQSEAMTCCSE
jgi:hypothetical protein